MRIRLGILILACTAQKLYAHSWRQRASTYSDDAGVIRQRYKVDMSVEQSFGGSGITASNYAVSASMEQYTKDNIEDDEYMQEVYGDNQRNTGTGSLMSSQTINKMTDVRVMGAYSSDKVQSSRTGGFGISRWVWKENLQLSADLSRTLVEAPVFETLGVQDIVAKSIGTSNPHNMIKATFAALKAIQAPRAVAAKRGKRMADIVTSKRNKSDTSSKAAEAAEA